MGYSFKIIRIDSNLTNDQLISINNELKDASKIEIIKNCENKRNKFIEVFVFYKKGEENV